MKLIPVNETNYNFLYCKVISNYYLMHSVVFFSSISSVHTDLCMKQIVGGGDVAYADLIQDYFMADSEPDSLVHN